METEKKQQKMISDMRSRVKDISLAISWREFSRTYFDKSVSWFYHKMDGIDGNGGNGGFNEEETQQFKDALMALAERIRKCAESI